MNRKRLVRLAVTAVIGLSIAGGAAYAAWSVSGSGSGSASAASAQGLTLTAGSASGVLYPGASADVDTTVANANPFPVHVSSIALDTTQGQNGFGVDAGHSGCNLSSLSFTTANNGSSGWDISANSSLDVDAASSITMGAGANDSCQGATFTVYLTATAASA
ncbi:MAG TPA: hypothetical protein VHS27_20730 [Gaiellales bacterium]|jgi:hypothetical protein|nr:hypothetical protein [Gaiellales bacterium]